jgi:hypothetical protein
MDVQLHAPTHLFPKNKTPIALSTEGWIKLRNVVQASRSVYVALFLSSYRFPQDSTPLKTEFLLNNI